MKTITNIIYPILAALLIIWGSLILSAGIARAGSATWDLNPSSTIFGLGDWNAPTNWTPTTVPNGTKDIATFGLSNTTSVNPFMGDNGAFPIEVNGIIFSSAATNPYTIIVSPLHGFGNASLTISGVGIVNNSGVTESFDVGAEFARGHLNFAHSATAANSRIKVTDNSSVSFLDSSTAGSAVFDIKAIGVFFFGDSSAGNATFIVGLNQPLNVDFSPGGLDFRDHSTAANSTIIGGLAGNGGFGGGIGFSGSSTAGRANIQGHGTLIVFGDSSKGGTARIGLFSFESSFGSILDISGHDAPGVAIGSLEGDEMASVSLGANHLTVGSNNGNTVFSGEIKDDFYAGGSLTKIGSGRLTLTSGSTYSGLTTVSGGTLLLKNTTGSATGTGAVRVTNGTLQGVGTISGAVIVGNGAGVLSVGNSATAPGTLTINNTLTFDPGSTYKCVLNRSTGKASKVSAVGVRIVSGTFTFADPGNGTLATGKVFTVINNTSGSPIDGTFSNLPEGSIFGSNGTNFKVSYKGGTGNDLTLTVVP